MSFICKRRIRKGERQYDEAKGYGTARRKSGRIKKTVKKEHGHLHFIKNGDIVTTKQDQKPYFEVAARPDKSTRKHPRTIRKGKEKMSLIHEFYIQKVFHLVGEQTLPVYLAALQFPVETTHYLLATEKTKRAAERIAGALKQKGIESETRLLGYANVLALASVRIENSDIYLGLGADLGYNLINDASIKGGISAELGIRFHRFKNLSLGLAFADHQYLFPIGEAENRFDVRVFMSSSF